jgi:hypothetical protein
LERRLAQDRWIGEAAPHRQEIQLEVDGDKEEEPVLAVDIRKGLVVPVASGAIPLAPTVTSCAPSRRQVWQTTELSGKPSSLAPITFAR